MSKSCYALQGKVVTDGSEMPIIQKQMLKEIIAAGKATLAKVSNKTQKAVIWEKLIEFALDANDHETGIDACDFLLEYYSEVKDTERATIDEVKALSDKANFLIIGERFEEAAIESQRAIYMFLSLSSKEDNPTFYGGLVFNKAQALLRMDRPKEAKEAWLDAYNNLPGDFKKKADKFLKGLNIQIDEALKAEKVKAA